jgi:hypothetical protein
MNAARVQSIDAIKSFRLSLAKFADIAGRILNNADAEMQRMLNWLETEQQSYWRDQVQKRTRTVAQAKDALMQKKLYKTIDGGHPSAVEEEKAFRLAVQRLEEADRKLVNVRRHAQRLQKEILVYRGQVQRFASTIQLDVPMAMTHLESLVEALEAYVATEVPQPAAETSGVGVARGFAADDQLPSMARPAPPAEAETGDDATPEHTGKPDETGGRKEGP